MAVAKIAKQNETQWTRRESARGVSWSGFVNGYQIIASQWDRYTEREAGVPGRRWWRDNRSEYVLLSPDGMVVKMGWFNSIDSLVNDAKESIASFELDVAENERRGQEYDADLYVRENNKNEVLATE